MIEANLDGIPEELKRLSRWVGWKVVERDGKSTKVPVDPKMLYLASTTDESTWAAFSEAVSAARASRLAGIGFVLGAPYTGIDLDQCRDAESGDIEPWAQEIVDNIRSYTEISPSGTGLHLIVRGSLPANGRRRTGKIEMYDAGRYFTITGVRVGTTDRVEDRQDALHGLYQKTFGSNGWPEAPKSSGGFDLDDQALIERAQNAANGHKFSRLLAGEWQDGYSSQSEADLAFCALLVFWTGGDRQRVDRLFRQSGLMREKWERDDYRTRTIEAAIAGTTGNSRPGSGAEPNLSNRSNHDRRPFSGSFSAQPETKIRSTDLLAYGSNDTGNAARIVALYGDVLRYCPAYKKWLYYDGRRWQVDDRGLATKLAKQTMIRFLEQAVRSEGGKAEGFASSSLDARRIKAALELAEPELAITPDQLDQHPFLLNVKNGTIDLITGDLRPHCREDYLTKLVNCDYQPQAGCARFTQFLDEIMGVSSESKRSQSLVRYLQKLFGYAITGAVSEKIVVCFFGEGDNGKSTLLEAVRHVIAEYSHQVMIGHLMVNQYANQTTASMADLADLKGARFVTTSEGERGQRLAESKIKYLSAGMGEIKACRKYENPVKFPATHKLFMDSNYKPIVRGTDNAIWNRLVSVPFNVVISKARIDKALPQKLKDESEGILAWLVEGCLLWQNEGLDEPFEVTSANEDWRAEMDPLSEFLEDCCELGPDCFCLNSEPWDRYTGGSDSRSERKIERNEFNERLEQNGCLRKKKKIDGRTQHAWVGIRLKDEHTG